MSRVDLFDKKAKASAWIQSNFWVPELKAPVWMAPYQIETMDMALELEENGDFKHSLIMWSDIKKSIKSTLGAAIALWRAFQLEWGSIKVVANDLKQAKSRSYFYLERSLRLNPVTNNMIERGEIKITKYRIDFLFNHTTIEAIPADPKGEAGGNDDMVLFTELWTYQHEAHRRLWTELVVPPNKFGRSFRWAESYAGFTGQSAILENLYQTNVKDEYRVEGTIAPLYKNGGTFTMWNHVPRLPWQSRKYYCLLLPDDKSELLVLTSVGWIAAEDITTDHALCTTRDRLEIEYQKPTSIFREHYSGELLRLKHYNVDITMTPNHRLYCDWVNHTRKYKQRVLDGHEWKFIDAQTASTKQAGWIPGHGVWKHKPLDVVRVEDEVYNASLFVELLGWYIAEGHVHHTYHTLISGERKGYPVMIQISQDKQKNNAKHTHIVRLCERMNLNFKETEYGIRIYNARLARYMKKFGKSYAKYIPRFVLDDCSSAQMKLFLFGFSCGDATKDGDAWVLYTNSDRLKMDLFELAFKCGYRVTDNGSWSSSPETGRLPIHHIRIMRSYIGWCGYGKKSHWTIEVAKLNTEVWCPTLPNGNFCVMINGKTMWTGNSQQMSELSEDEFRRVHRNEWVGSTSKFVQDLWWDSCRIENTKIDSLETVVVAVDAAYAENGDCFSVVVVGKHPTDHDKYAVKEARFWQAGSNGKLEFKNVEDEKDPRYPFGYVIDLAKRYRVLEVAYDPYQLHSMATEQNKKRYAFWREFTQGKPRSVADNELYDAIRDGTLAHPGIDQLSEHVKNAGRDSKGRLVKLSKKKKIDGAVATSMANNRARYYRL